MLRTRSHPNTANPNLSPGSNPQFEPDTPIAHYDNRTHAHAQPENEIDPLDSSARRMSAPNEGLATRRGGKGMLLNGLSKLQNFGNGAKGKGKAQYRLGMSPLCCLWRLKPGLIFRIISSRMVTSDSDHRFDPHDKALVP